MSEFKTYMYASSLALLVIITFFTISANRIKHQKFNSADYNFSFDYATTAKIDTSQELVVLNFNPSKEGRIEIDFNNLYQLDSSIISQYPKMSFKIDNQEVFLHPKTTEGADQVPEYYIIKNNRIFRFTVVAINHKIQKKFEQLLSSFKFNDL